MLHTLILPCFSQGLLLCGSKMKSIVGIILCTKMENSKSGYIKRHICAQERIAKTLCTEHMHMHT